MNRRKNQNILLVEIMIAVLFFALCSTVILETFVAARETGSRAEMRMKALVEIQDVVQRLAMAQDPARLLEADGFLAEGDIWRRDGDDFRMEVELGVQSTPAGRMETAQIHAICKDEVIAELPWARYLPGEVDL